MQPGPMVDPNNGKKVEFKRCDRCEMTFRSFQDICPQCGNADLEIPIEANQLPDHLRQGGNIYEIS